LFEEQLVKIAHIAPTSYSAGKKTYYQFIRGGIGADYHQEPRFHLFPDGEVLMYWSAYDFDECSNNSVKLFSLSRDSGTTWTDPQVYLADFAGGVPYFVFMLSIGRDEALMICTRTRHDAVGVDERSRVATKGSNYFRSSTRVFLRRSVDGGRTFDYGEEVPHSLISRGRELPHVGFYGSPDDLVSLSSGRIIAAFTYMDPDRSNGETGVQHYTGACLYSDDRGRSWRRSTDIAVDTPRGAMELQIAETEPNQLLCLFRTKGGFVYQTISEDGGESWSPGEPSPLPAPESMPRMIRLKSGNLLVAWNNVSSTTQQPRHPIVAALSRDGGRSWSSPKIIADETGTHQLSNHGIIELPDGRILHGISHYRDVKPMTSDLDLAVYDERWVAEG
jgi:hypothetical protein